MVLLESNKIYLENTVPSGGAKVGWGPGRTFLTSFFHLKFSSTPQKNFDTGATTDSTLLTFPASHLWKFF